MLLKSTLDIGDVERLVMGISCDHYAGNLLTDLTTYRGRDHFQRSAEATGDRNVGSRMAPRRLRDTAVQS